MRLIAAMAAMAGFFSTNVKKCQRKINTYKGWKVPAIAAIAARVPLPLDCTRVIITPFEQQSRPHCQGVITGYGSSLATLHAGHSQRVNPLGYGGNT